METKENLEDIDLTLEKGDIKELLGLKEDNTYVQSEQENDDIPLYFNAGQLKALENGNSKRNRLLRDMYRKTGKCYFGRKPNC
ncbi:MAG: hypothetical protein JW791_03295 [Nanoarchaeota archaeon]|nr:hypothetical protein [Nanoarchaeota archaeon]